jgi:hypothetical protein
MLLTLPHPARAVIASARSAERVEMRTVKVVSFVPNYP